MHAGIDRIASAGSIDAIIVSQGVPAEASEAAISAATDLDSLLVVNLGPEAIERERAINPNLFDLADLLVVNEIEATFLAELLHLVEPPREAIARTTVLREATHPRQAKV